VPVTEPDSINKANKKIDLFETLSPNDLTNRLSKKKKKIHRIIVTKGTSALQVIDL